MVSEREQFAAGSIELEAKYWFAKAKQTAASIRENSTRSRALSEIAIAQAKAGDLAGAQHIFEQAKQTAAGMIEGIVAESIALGEIAVAQTKAGDLAGAQLTAAGMTNDEWKSRPFSAIAATQAKAGDLMGAKQTFEQAKQTVAGMDSDDAFKWEVVTDIAVAQVNAGDLAGAQQTVALISISRGREFANLTTIATAQVNAGDLAGAQQTFEHSWREASIPDQSASDAHRAVIAAQTRAGDVRRAVTWANTITDPMERVWVLLGLAEGLMPLSSVDEEVH